MQTSATLPVFTHEELYSEPAAARLRKMANSAILYADRFLATEIFTRSQVQTVVRAMDRFWGTRIF